MRGKFKDGHNDAIAMMYMDHVEAGRIYRDTGAKPDSLATRYRCYLRSHVSARDSCDSRGDVHKPSYTELSLPTPHLLVLRVGTIPTGD